MLICPKCNQEYNLEHYKKRGVCSICGFKLPDTPLQKDIQKETKTILPDNESKIKPLKIETLKSHITQKNAEKNGNIPQKKTPSKQYITEKLEQSIEKKLVTNNNSCKNVENPSSVASYSAYKDDPIFLSNSGNNIDNTDMEENIKDTTDFESNYIDDPIFLNSEGPLDIDEESSLSDFEISDDATDVIHEDIEDEFVSHTPPKKNPPDTDIHLPFKLEKFPLIRLITKFITYRRHKNDEQFETNEMTFHFNKDGFYNDTEPDVPPEIDIIPPKTIFKVFAAIIFIFLLIAFIIYYA